MARILLHRFGRSGRFRRRGSLSGTWSVYWLAVRGFKFEVAAKAGWGYTAWAVEGPRGRREAFPHAATYMEMAKMKRKRQAADAPAGKHVAPLESSILSKHHSLVAHMAVVQYDDGGARVPGWISIKTIGAAWQIEIKDPDTLQLLRVVQATLDDALTLAALLLDSEDAPWEPDTWAQQRAKTARPKK